MARYKSRITDSTALYTVLKVCCMSSRQHCTWSLYSFCTGNSSLRTRSSKKLECFSHSVNSGHYFANEKKKKIVHLLCNLRNKVSRWTKSAIFYQKSLTEPGGKKVRMITQNTLSRQSAFTSINRESLRRRGGLQLSNSWWAYLRDRGESWRFPDPLIIITSYRGREAQPAADLPQSSQPKSLTLAHCSENDLMQY